MSEVIRCPNCNFEIDQKSLAEPFMRQLREELAVEAKAKQKKLDEQSAELRAEKAKLQSEQEAFDEQLQLAKKQVKADAEKRIEATLTEEREKLRQEAQLKAREETSTELKLLKEQNEAKAAKLKEAQEQELELRKERAALKEQQEQLQLEAQRAIDAARDQIKQQARKDADEAHRLKLAEKEKQLEDQKKQLADMQRKLEQGSQQLQGEVQELDLEKQLVEKFPFDSIEPVPKGQFGGDTIHSVFGPSNQPCGTILWESKRTKNWVEGWLSKLREDCRQAKADIAIIVSEALPKGVESFELRDNVWVVHPRYAIPVGAILRASLIEISGVRMASVGQQTKEQLVYKYVTSSEFRRRVEAIAEAISDLQEGLEKEKRAIRKHWAAREKQLDRVIESTLGMHGDVQGIAGSAVAELDGIGLNALIDGSGVKHD